ncbi:MAG: hypothetical protein IPP07_06940 [Holophagales bacterium]|nr:hypothetical protein [Holophagales bacterium]MBK9964640.1 hypothetical protein [Holophagales bacterium]
MSADAPPERLRPGLGREAGQTTRVRFWLPAVAVYVGAFLAQTWTLGKVMLPSVDEGVYLYVARLILDGKVPYRDFFISHPPWEFLGAAGGLWVTGGDVPAFSVFYAAWVLLALFPIYRTVASLTGRLLPAFWAVVLFVTYPDFARWDARFFALRQASVPFLALGVDLALRGKRPALAGSLLGVFAACVIPNVPIALLVLAGLVLFGSEGGPGDVARSVRQQKRLLFSFVLTAGALYGVAFAIPGAPWDLVLFQFGRPRAPILERLLNVWTDSLPASAVLLLLGFFGAFLVFRASRGISLAAAAGFLLGLLAYNYYSAHHLASVVPLMAISAGVAFSIVSRGRTAEIVASAGLALALGVTALPALKGPLIDARSPNLFRVVQELEACREPVFTAQPLYALHAGRRLTFHRFAADMRSFRVSNLPPFSDEDFADVVSRSNTVLLEPLLFTMLTPARMQLLAGQFAIRFQDPEHGILVRRSPPPGPGTAPSAPAGPK